MSVSLLRQNEYMLHRDFLLIMLIFFEHVNKFTLSGTCVVIIRLSQLAVKVLHDLSSQTCAAAPAAPFVLEGSRSIETTISP